MKYVCSYCGKSSENIEDIKACEAKHEELRKKKEEAKAKREALHAEFLNDYRVIEEAVKKINDKYSACDFPKIGIYKTTTTDSYLSDSFVNLLSDFLR